MDKLSGKTATACGLAAILLWSCSNGLIRGVSEIYGAIAGAAMIHTLGAVMLLALLGRPRLRATPRFYLIVGSALFVAYEVFIFLALGYARTRVQSIEVGVINYMWPCLTVLLAIIMNGQKARWIIVPGTALALFGVLWVMSGSGLSLAAIIENIRANPLSYSLALGGAISFAFYCNVTRRYAAGQNLVALFMVVASAVLWLKYLISDEHMPALALNGTGELLAAALSMAGGYALWNIGILRGNLTLLATASYSSPVLASVFSSLWLGTALSLQFWQGAVLVTSGSLLCWYAARERKASEPLCQTTQ